jgi:hypothetical protein
VRRIHPCIAPTVLARERDRPDEENVWATDRRNEEHRPCLPNERSAHLGGYKIILALFLVDKHRRIEDVVGVNAKELVPIWLSDRDVR